ncbi:HET-domain-containing protein [Hypoxylon fuscum]|nr:HET-domain-containing protein [Hypoxylon fuscum]
MSSAREEWRATKSALSKLYKNVLKPAPPDNSDSEDESNSDNGTAAILPPAEYQYVSFSGENCIRLLELQPGKRRDPIICQLRETRLDTCAGRYDALSYVWGPPEGAIRIQVNDGSLEIRPNLHCALTSLRHADRPRILWVDAICINQLDIPERNAQVPMMREIYRNAGCTICFLGPKHNTTRGLYDMLEDLAQEARTLHADGPTSDEMDTVPAFVNHVSVNPVKSELREKYIGDFTILAMAACKWWHRAWTVQEMLLSSNVLFMNGRYTIKWETVCVAVDHGFNIQIWTPMSFGFVMDRAIIPYLSMRALMTRRRLRAPYPARQPSWHSAYDLLHFLTHSRHRESADPRDKIYAVLGLLRDAHSRAMTPETSDSLDIKLDYHHPVVYVYRKTAQTLISNLDSLDILGTVPKSTRRALPSWVTDWSITSPIGSPLTQDSLDRDRITHATKHTNANAHFPDDGVTMILSGHELTSIAELAETLPNLDHNSREESAYSQGQPRPKRGWLTSIRAVFQNEHELFRRLMSVFDTLFAWARFSTTQPATNPSEDPNSIFWQTLCAGTYRNGSAQETKAIFQTWFNSLQPVRDFMERHPDTHDYLPEIAFAKLLNNTWESYGEFWPYIACAHHRRLGRAANGWLCLVPKETQLGDVIILACGGRVPLILRSDGDGYNMFVGEAYIHGIMNGEAFDFKKCNDVKIC